MASLPFGVHRLAPPVAPTGPKRGGGGGGAQISRFGLLVVRCGLRGAGTRKPLWRSSVMSSEAIQAVQALKLARKSLSGPDASPVSSADRKVEKVFQGTISRLIKADLVAVLAELQRQNEWELALQVFDYIRKEEWYKPDLSLYSDMIFMAGKNKLIEVAEQIFSDIKKDGLEPNTRAYTEIIGAFLQVGLLEKAMEMYYSMKESGCPPNELTFTILIRNLEKAKEHDLASTVKNDCEEFLEQPEKFLEKVNNKYPKRRPLKLV